MPARCWEQHQHSACAPLLPGASCQQLVSPGPSTLPSAEGRLGIWASRSPSLGFLLNQNGFWSSSPPPTRGRTTCTQRPAAIEPTHTGPPSRALATTCGSQYCPLLTTSPIKHTHTHTPEVAEWLQRLLSNYLKCWHLCTRDYSYTESSGRWGANVVHTGACQGST